MKKIILIASLALTTACGSAPTPADKIQTACGQLDKSTLVQTGTVCGLSYWTTTVNGYGETIILGGNGYSANGTYPVSEFHTQGSSTDADGNVSYDHACLFVNSTPQGAPSVSFISGSSGCTFQATGNGAS